MKLSSKEGINFISKLNNTPHIDTIFIRFVWITLMVQIDTSIKLLSIFLKPTLTQK